jgi:hypothetical protein
MFVIYFSMKECLFKSDSRLWKFVEWISVVLFLLAVSDLSSCRISFTLIPLNHVLFQTTHRVWNRMRKIRGGFMKKKNKRRKTGATSWTLKGTPYPYRPIDKLTDQIFFSCTYSITTFGNKTDGCNITYTDFLNFTSISILASLKKWSTLFPFQSGGQRLPTDNLVFLSDHRPHKIIIS